MMKVKIGDKVKFLNEVGGGIVKKIIDKEMIEVETDDGFELPILMSEVLVMHEEQETTKEKEPEEESTETNLNYEVSFDKDSDEVACYFAFIHQNQEKKEASKLDIYLINDSNFYFSYNILIPIEKRYESVYRGVIEPNIKILLGEIEPENFAGSTRYYVQGYFFRHFRHEIKPFVDNELKFSAKKFYQVGSFQENDFFDEDALIYPIIEENKMENSLNNMSKEELSKVIKEKEQKRSSKPKSLHYKEKQQMLDKRIIDLHIHELIDDETGLSASDMLQIQMQHFNNEMEKALHEGVKKIVFIHGVGNGRLKMDVRKELDRKYKKYQYQDASFKEYGWGATMVMIKLH